MPVNPDASRLMRAEDSKGFSAFNSRLRRGWTVEGREAAFLLLSGQRALQLGILSEALIKELGTAKMLITETALFVGMPRF